MKRSTDSPEVHVSLSAAACGRPRGQRAVVDSASTSVRPRSVHVQQQRTRRRRRRGTALVTTHDGDAGVPHVAHSRRGCLVSSASTVQLRFTATTVDSKRRTTSDDCWTPEVVTPLRHTASVSSTRRPGYSYDVCSCRLISLRLN